MESALRFEKYYAASEVTVLAVCFVMLVLLLVSFKVRMRTFRIFAASLWMLITAVCADLLLHRLIAANPDTPVWIIYGLRCVYHLLLFCLLYNFVTYTCEATYLSQRSRKPYVLSARILLACFFAADAAGICSGRFMRIENGQIGFEGSLVFSIGYVLFIILIAVLLGRVRRRLYRQVMNGFIGVALFSIAVIAAARILYQSTYTASTFLFPLIAMMYLMHSNPYDAKMGTNDLRGLNNLIRYMEEADLKYLYMSLYMRELDENGKTLSDEMRDLIRHVAESTFRKSVLFQAGNGHILLMVPMEKNPGCEKRIEKVLEEFKTEYENFRYDFKLVIGRTCRELNARNDYISFIRSIHTRIPENTIYTVKPDDLEKFRQYEVILKALANIAEKKDPGDPRVLVYCQPVYNIRTGQFDTAEALMRLKLEEIGIVPPDQFIPLAEENRYIHALTEIILSKTCRALHNMIAEGYEITRISVNVSALELRNPNFCGDIDRIITESEIDTGRIAIELTESRNDSDFLLMKQRIEELKQKGITFYLDDFGTGYSNMERILELPFDIIKFDRSMVVASAQDKKSEQVLSSLGDLFSRLNYSVLYEGVENEKDEEMCRGLSASYLQGYKYSKPLPIAELRRFLTRS